MPAPTSSTLPDLHRAFIANAVDKLAADSRVIGIAAAGSYAAFENRKRKSWDLLQRRTD
jgi:hypothetical protein